MTDISPDERAAVETLLDAPLAESRIKGKNVGGGASSPYLETFDVIETANRIFGYGGWSSRVIGSPMFVEALNGYVAEVEVTALGVTHSDVGTNILAGGAQGPKPSHHDMSIKGAVAGALKRALRHFGDQFGNSLYDKDEYPPLRPGEDRPQQSGRDASEAPRDRPGPTPPQPRQSQSEMADGGGGFRNASDFFSWVWQEHKLNRTVACELLKVDPAEVADNFEHWKQRLTTRLAEVDTTRRSGG